ncbi:hypothetical protein LJ655_15090 [Paraburkholderia sp. MMS20-SJTN17]|uniref:Uncharacterized protein n=1 Tax=Paraburkholderia translucens TaxID=2886945 RepID=A0ABS8KFP2_9BURK|nr:hypothetical protein [Paraburkholderia sp. MMS20-SJTN17]MCC8403197.1 hypothetical protein [Paraburkholderia sp. MMS20-SJTN17]
MEQQGQEGTGELMTGEEECLCCRVTYSIYSKFPPMPHAMALNVETGAWFPFDRLRSYPTGYQMAEALGYASACNCRGRSQALAGYGRHRLGGPSSSPADNDELEHYFEIVDATTYTPIEGMTYKLLSDDGVSLVDNESLVAGKTMPLSKKIYPNLSFIAWRNGDVR